MLLSIDSAESDETEKLNDNGSEDISHKVQRNNVVEGKTKTNGKIGNVNTINIKHLYCLGRVVFRCRDVWIISNSQ